jgi:hypothetical protein
MLKALAEAVARYTETREGESPFSTAIEGLTILRSDHEKSPDHMIFKPALCIVVQGAKWAIFGEKRYDYRAGQALVVSVEMPALGRVAEASPREPCLVVILEFDLSAMREVLESLETPIAATENFGLGVFVSDFDGPLCDCMLRLVRLLETPEVIPVLSPLIMREIFYWLLTGPQGGQVAKIALANGHAESVIRAIHTLRSRFTETVKIEELALIAQMSPSAFQGDYRDNTATVPETTPPARGAAIDGERGI